MRISMPARGGGELQLQRGDSSEGQTRHGHGRLGYREEMRVSQACDSDATARLLSPSSRPSAPFALLALVPIAMSINRLVELFQSSIRFES